MTRVLFLLDESFALAGRVADGTKPKAECYANALNALLDLSDNDLLDLLLRRKQPQDAWVTPDVLALLREMQRPAEDT